MRHDLVRIHGVDGIAAGAAAFTPEPLQSARTPAAKLVAYARANPSLIRRRAITFTEYAFPKTKAVPEHQAYDITDTTNRDFREHPFSPVFASGKHGSAARRRRRESRNDRGVVPHQRHDGIARVSYPPDGLRAESSVGIPIMVYTTFVPVGKLLPNPRDPNYPLVKPSITKILLDFRNVPKGTFVFHCHMLFHEDNGMMAVIRVE